MTEEDDQGYRWETEYEKTWEVLQEDAEGSLQASIDELVHKAKRRKQLEKITNVRLGMMRHMFIIIDMSSAMDDQDLKPSRLVCSLKLLEHFIEEYFDQNPISQLGIIVTKNKRAEKITELGERACQGEPSLQNSLELAMQTLRHMPGHASREVVCIFGSLTTCDPGDILETIKLVGESNIRCSMIGLSAEVRVCRKLCSDTNGRYTVILDESHFKDLLNQHTSPPPAMMNTESSLIRMGFPHQQLGSDKDKPAITTGYFCPQCKSKYCELPIECKACGLTLVSAPHLARSYHHLFPLDQSKEVPVTDFDPGFNIYCYACQGQISEQSVYRCVKCKNLFCIDCDIFIHDTLHSCPGCASSRNTQTAEAVFT
ncbi:TF2H2-like protein [Mya arenaria]|uniref:TF2H2-like protein n=1 Tax=Mya arenaria TaxID=6604 RepID=A0ABY7EZM3_MYAAR|nr:TF2H2-like protein [Mya arenaria]